jgi:hypothetical protein
VAGEENIAQYDRASGILPMHKGTTTNRKWRRITEKRKLHTELDKNIK